MLKWLATLPLSVSFLCSFLLMCLNFVVTYTIAAHVKKHFETTGSAEFAMSRLRTLTRYIQPLFLFITIFGVTFLLTVHLKQFHVSHFVGRFVAMLLPLMVIFSISIGNLLILYPVNQQIRGTSDRRTEQIGLLIRFLLLLLAPFVLFWMIQIAVPREWKENLFSDRFWTVLLPMLLIVIVNLISPLFVGMTLMAVPMPASELYDRLQALLIKVNIQKVKIYTWPTVESRVANALVSCFFTKRIYISDYLIGNCTTEEILAILAHEIGHIKKYHLWIRLALVTGWVPLVFGMGYLGEQFAKQAPHWVIFTSFGVLFFLYFGITLLFIKRSQERQADAYVLSLGINPEDFISSLYKLAKLNHMTLQLNHVDEKFQTHPSFGKRIKWIAQQANFTDDRVNSIQEMVQESLFYSY